MNLNKRLGKTTPKTLALLSRQSISFFMTSRINGRICMQVPIDVTPLSKSSFASSTDV